MSENAQAHQESLQVLLDVCLLLSSKVDLPELLKTILSLASRVVNAETASLLLLDAQTQELYFDVALGLDPAVSKIRLKMGQGIAGAVAQTGKPAIINDAKSDPRWSSTVDKQSGFQTRSILAVPMTIKGKLVGVVEAINHLHGPFGDIDLRLFEAFASQAAIAIDNARLFASLQEEKAKLDTAFNEMRDGVILTDEAGTVLLANPAASRFLGLSGGPATSLSTAFAATRVVPSFEKLASRSNEPVPFEVVRDKPKRLILAGTAYSFKFQAVGSKQATYGRFFVFRDVTEERQEELLKRSFLSLVSHKLMTPLVSITGYSEVLLMDGDLPKPTLSALTAISGQGKKLADLVEKLLAFTNLEGLDPATLKQQSFPIDRAVEQATAALQKLLDAQKAEIVVESAPDVTVFGDPSLIRDALKNLIENGAKFNTKEKKRISIRSEAQDDFVIVRIEDNGPGIPPEDLEKVFSKFHQVEASFTGQVEGAGLGLPFVKKVIEFHGGKVWLESRLAEGTTASVMLPRPKKS